jgi:hypothetical protein
VILKTPGSPVEQHHPGSIAFGQGLLGDQFAREWIIILVD